MSSKQSNLAAVNDSAFTDPDTDIEKATIEEYEQLNNKLDTVINKIKGRKRNKLKK